MNLLEFNQYVPRNSTSAISTCKNTQKSSNSGLGSVKTAKNGFKWRCFCKNLDETGLKLRIIC